MQKNKQEKKKEKLENVIQNEIFSYLIEHNYFFWRSNNIPVFGKNNGGKYMYRSLPKHTPRGLPDIIVIHEGKFIAIEVKRVGAKLSDTQADFGLKVVKNKAYYIVARSVEELDNEMKRIVNYRVLPKGHEAGKLPITTLDRKHAP